MAISYPALCTTDASRWVFCFELSEQLRLWHNTQCAGKSAEWARDFRKNEYVAKEKEVFAAMSAHANTNLATAHWKPTLPDAVTGGVIAYPPGLKDDNEGSKVACLQELNKELRMDGRNMISDADAQLVTAELARVKRDILDKKFWNAGTGDLT